MDALRRFLAWQIGARWVPGPVACPFANNSWLLAQPGMSGATGNVYVGLHEFEDMAFVLHFLRSGDLFVDVGANIGSYTVLAAAGVGAESIAFEPGETAFSWLKRNIRLNGITDLVVSKQKAVGAISGYGLLTRDGDCVNFIVTDSASSVQADVVAITTLDESLAERTPLMIKLDVEGYETEVLKGSINTLADPDLKCILIELNGSGRRYGYCDADIRHQLMKSGFSEYIYFPFERKILPKNNSRYRSDNALFIRDQIFVEARLLNANPIAIQGIQI
jgi:FkbM family methyltransferase